MTRPAHRHRRADPAPPCTEDARASDADIAAQVGLSSSAVARHIKRLEDLGIIAGYTVVLDSGCAGRPIQSVHRGPLRRGHEHRRDPGHPRPTWPGIQAVFTTAGDPWRAGVAAGARRRPPGTGDRAAAPQRQGHRHEDAHRPRVLDPADSAHHDAPASVTKPAASAANPAGGPGATATPSPRRTAGGGTLTSVRDAKRPRAETEEALPLRDRRPRRLARALLPAGPDRRAAGPPAAARDRRTSSPPGRGDHRRTWWR